MKGHPHHKGAGMSAMGNAHWEKKPGEPMMADGKYTEGEMSNPEHLKESVSKLASYTKSHRAKH